MKWEKEVCGGKSCRFTMIDVWCSVMCLSAFIITIIVVFAVRPYCLGTTIVTRSEWKAAEAKGAKKLKEAASVVIIHHTERARCDNTNNCGEEMRNLQKFHMETKGWDDIGYNFLVGDDGTVYEGRGWDVEGAHTLSWNNVSLGIGIMGDYDKAEPDERAVRGLQLIIACGVTRGYIKEGYKVYGRADIREGSAGITSPGKHLHALVKKWHRYDSKTPSHSSLKPVSSR